MKAIVAVEDLGADRFQTHGRIRLGVKTAKAMKAIDHFRFTSPDEAAIRQISAIYGGEARPWKEPRANPPDQWEVLTEAKEIRVFLPPGALSCHYELWSGGGCVRRCDGRECEVAENSGDDAEMVKVPCLCKQENGMLCRPYSRLNVILPEVRFGGAWLLETKGWNAANELPKMETLIRSLQDHGVIEAVLCLERAQAKGGTRKFVVPRLRLSASALELAAGQASVGALHGGASGLKALPAAPDATEPGGVHTGVVVPVQRDWYDASDDDVVVDAELVDEVVGEDGGVPAPTPGDVPSSSSNVRDAVPAVPRSGALSPVETKFLLECQAAAEFVSGTDGDFIRHALARKVSKGRTESSRCLSDAELSDGIELALSLSSEIMRGRVTRREPPTVKIEPR